MGQVEFFLVEMKARQVECLRRFYGSLGIELAKNQNLRQMRSESSGVEA
jgi:hypothetical protein